MSCLKAFGEYISRCFYLYEKLWEENSMLCCCKECKYNCSCDKRCSFLKAQLKYIKCCPMMIQNEFLNDAEKYMKDNDPSFIRGFWF